MKIKNAIACLVALALGAGNVYSQVLLTESLVYSVDNTTPFELEIKNPGATNDDVYVLKNLAAWEEFKVQHNAGDLYSSGNPDWYLFVGSDGLPTDINMYLENAPVGGDIWVGGASLYGELTAALPSTFWLNGPNLSFEFAALPWNQPYYFFGRKYDPLTDTSVILGFNAYSEQRQVTQGQDTYMAHFLLIDKVYEISAVPEPATIALIGVGGLLVLPILRRRLRKQS